MAWGPDLDFQYDRDAASDVIIAAPTYYAWVRDYDSYHYYTTSETPSAGDPLYEESNGVIVATTEYVTLGSYDSSTTPPRLRISDLADWDWYYRDSADDIPGADSSSSNTPTLTPVTHTYVGDHLYGWTDPGETLYAWQSDYNPELGDTLYYIDANDNMVYIPYNTIYTKTSTIDTSTSVYYLSDGTELSLYNLFEGAYSAEYIESADANQISISFTD